MPDNPHSPLKPNAWLLPPQFVRDCIECDCDIGSVSFDYRGAHLDATPTQIAELADRARHYAYGGTDASPQGLEAAAMRCLRAMRRLGLIS